MKSSTTLKNTGNNISKFILNEKTQIFRDTLKQINKDFYNDFEKTTLKAFKLDHLREEDFKMLKKLGLRRQNIK